MRRGLVGLLGALGLGAAFLAGRWTAPGGDAPPSADPRPTASDDRPAAGAPALATADAHVAEDRPLQAFREALAALPPAVRPRGTGRITGTVRSAARAPLSGVVVRARPHDAPTERALPASAEPAARVRSYAESLLRSRSGSYSATTDAQGAYVLDGLPDAPVTLFASMDGWKFSSTAQEDSGVRPGAAVDFTGAANSGVRYELRLPDGSVPSSAGIEMQRASTSWSYGWEPGAEPFDAEPGSYVVTARSGDGALSSEPSNVVVEAGKVTVVRIDLRDRPAIRLHVRWPEGERFDKSAVRLIELAEGERGDPAALERAQDHASRDAEEAGQDTRIVPDLQAGRYLVGLTRGWGGRLAASVVVDVGERATDVELVVPPLERSAYVLLTILDPEGRTVQGPAASMLTKSPSQSRGEPATLLKKPDGVLWLVPPLGGAAGTETRQWLTLSTPALGTKVVEIRPNPAPEITVRFEAPGTVEIQCEGIPDPRVRSRLFVSLQWADETLRAVGRLADSRLSRDGVAVVTPVQPGAYEAVVTESEDERGYWGIPLLRVPATVVSGPQRVSARLPALYAVTVQAGSTLVLSREGDPSWQAVRDGQGRPVRFDALPAGTYHVRAGGKDVPFTLPGPAEVDAR